MNDERVKKVIKDTATGTTVRHTSPSKILSSKIILPKVEEQFQIAKTASQYDDVLERKKQKLAQTQSLKKSLMQDLLTGKKRVQLN